MKYNDTIEILKTIINAINDPMDIVEKFQKSKELKSKKATHLNNSIYEEEESSDKEDNESVPKDDSKSYNESNGYYNKQQEASSNPQGVIDSIAQELTSARLQQAIILSEIVGKPRSKTRQRRRF